MNLPFSERTQSVMGLARGEAIHLRNNYLGTEHILLGILCESAGIASEVLKSFNVTLDQVRSGIENLIGMGPPGRIYDEIRPTDRAKQVMAFAMEEAVRHRSTKLEPEHLLLGIARVGQGVAANVLVNLQAPLQSIQEKLSPQINSSDANP